MTVDHIMIERDALHDRVDGDEVRTRNPSLNQQGNGAREILGIAVVERDAHTGTPIDSAANSTLGFLQGNEVDVVPQPGNGCLERGSRRGPCVCSVIGDTMQRQDSDRCSPFRASPL